MILTLKLLLWLIPIALNVWIDRNGRKPNYLLMFILRGFAAILHGILFNPHKYDRLFAGIPISSNIILDSV